MGEWGDKCEIKGKLIYHQFSLRRPSCWPPELPFTCFWREYLGEWGVILFLLSTDLIKKRYRLFLNRQKTEDCFLCH